MYAIQEKKLGNVELLLESNANVKIKNKEGDSFHAFLLNGQVLLHFGTEFLLPERLKGTT